MPYLCNKASTLLSTKRAVADGMLGFDAKSLTGRFQSRTRGNQARRGRAARVAVGAVRPPTGMPCPEVESAHLRQGSSRRPVRCRWTSGPPPSVHAHPGWPVGVDRTSHSTPSGAFGEREFVGRQSVLRRSGRCPTVQPPRTDGRRACRRPSHTAMLPGSCPSDSTAVAGSGSGFASLVGRRVPLIAHDHPAFDRPRSTGWRSNRGTPSWPHSSAASASR